MREKLKRLIDDLFGGHAGFIVLGVMLICLVVIYVFVREMLEV